MKKLQLGYGTIAALIWLLIVGAGGFGWIENVLKLIHTDPVFTGMGIARIVGVFMVPLGVVLGYVG